MIEINGAITENPEIIANIFNNFFTNIGPDHKNNIPVCNENLTDYLNKGVNNYLHGLNNWLRIRRFFFFEF